MRAASLRAARCAPAWLAVVVTFRPLWARRVLLPLAALIVVSFTGAAIAVPEPFGAPDRIAMVLFGGVFAAGFLRLAAVRIETDDEGLTVVNVVRRRRLAWAEVVDLRLPPGDPWLVLDLSDGQALPAMGVQGSDGAYAREQARALGRLVADHTRAGADPA